MNRLFLAVLACLALGGSARAQAFFLDDFIGSDLAAHWRRPPARDWAYNVSGGQLNVTGLFYPGNPKGCCNNTSIGTLFDGPSGDFRITARMGWDPGTDQGILVRFGSSFIFGYQAWGGQTPRVFALNGLDTVEMPPPPPGMHEFTLERRGATYRFSLNGAPVGSLAADDYPLRSLDVLFWGPGFQAPLGPLHVDRIEVVPTPSGFAAFGVLAALGPGIRRPRRPNHGWGTHCGPPSRTSHRSAV
jgi:hypothetical protein